MSKTTAPLLSLGASGQIASTLVASSWKGISYMRKYVIPANPRTAGQIAQRDVVAASVNAWRMYLTDAVIRTAWAVRAGIAGSAMSGFNAAVSSLAKILKTNPDASYVYSAIEGSQQITFGLKNMDDGATGDEAGNFEVWIGTTASNASLKETKTISSGAITITSVGAVGATVFVELRKDGQSRSGIFKMILTA